MSYKFRCYPNDEQATMLDQTFGCVRVIYNKTLDFSKREYELGNKLNIKDWSKYLTALKKDPDYEWLNSVSSVPLQQALRHLKNAFDRFFKLKSGYPTFKKRNNRQSAHYMSNAFKYCEETRVVKLAKMNAPLKIKYSRRFVGKPTSICISKTGSNRYYISMVIEKTIEKLKPVSKAVGLDLGISSHIVCSDGVVFENKRITKKYENKLAKASRAFSFKKRVKGALNKNYFKALNKVTKIHQKIADARMDYTHKMTRKLINENQVICIETLDVKNMLKNKHLAKSISDVNFGELVRQLEYKADWYGRTISKVDQFYPSSKTCSSCGSLYEGKWSLSIRKWTCHCGEHHDRDLNAAKNILKEGLRLHHKIAEKQQVRLEEPTL